MVHQRKLKTAIQKKKEVGVKIYTRNIMKLLEFKVLFI